MALQAELGLDCAAARPLVAFISRLTRQKMADTLLEAVPALLELGLDLVVHGAGDADLETAFQSFSEGPGRFVAKIGYQERLAHRLHAGADIVLAPARFEPCGLSQLYAMCYGALPLVRRTGGLADTVVDAAEGPGAATGFMFESATTPDLLRCIERAVDAHREPVRWRRMQVNAMSQERRWGRSARMYAELYRRVAKRTGPHELPRAGMREAAEPRRRSQGG